MLWGVALLVGLFGLLWFWWTGQTPTTAQTPPSTQPTKSPSPEPKEEVPPSPTAPPKPSVPVTSPIQENQIDQEIWNEGKLGVLPTIPQIHSDAAPSLVHSKGVWIVDSGSYLTKAGTPGIDPSIIIPTVVSYHAMTGKREYMVGQEAMDRRKQWRVQSPMRNDTIRDSAGVEALWNSLLESGLTQCQQDYLSELSLLITAPTKSREKTLEILFETIGMERVLLRSQELFALHDQGLWTGLSVHLGNESSSVVPFYSGCRLQYAESSFDWNGRRIVDTLVSRIDWGSGTSKLGKMDDQMKDSLARTLAATEAYVPTPHGMKPSILSEAYPHGGSALSRAGLLVDKRYTLGLLKGTAGDVGEGFFSEGNGEKSLSQTIWDVIQQCDTQLQPRMWKNIVLHGGTSAMQGLAPRLQAELSALQEASSLSFGPPSLLYADDPCLAAWRGATNLAQTDLCSKLFVDSHTWNEHGPSLARSYFLC